MSLLTVIIPARNEEGSVHAVTISAGEALTAAGLSYKLILINDGSTDATGQILDRLKSDHPSTIEVIHHAQSKNLGGAYKSALPSVTTPFVTWIPADGEISLDSLLRSLVASPGGLRAEEVIVPYPVGSRRSRSFGRLLLSLIFQRSLNFLFLNRIRYFNGNAIYSTSLVRAVPIRSNGYFFNAELLLRVLALFHPQVRQIPFELERRKNGKSKALKPANLVDVIASLTRLRVSLWLGRAVGSSPSC